MLAGKRLPEILAQAAADTVARDGDAGV